MQPGAARCHKVPRQSRNVYDTWHQELYHHRWKASWLSSHSSCCPTVKPPARPAWLQPSMTAQHSMATSAFQCCAPTDFPNPPQVGRSEPSFVLTDFVAYECLVYMDKLAASDKLVASVGLVFSTQSFSQVLDPLGAKASCLYLRTFRYIALLVAFNLIY